MPKHERSSKHRSRYEPYRESKHARDAEKYGLSYFDSNHVYLVAKWCGSDIYRLCYRIYPVSVDLAEDALEFFERDAAREHGESQFDYGDDREPVFYIVKRKRVLKFLKLVLTEDFLFEHIDISREARPLTMEDLVETTSDPEDGIELTSSDGSSSSDSGSEDERKTRPEPPPDTDGDSGESDEDEYDSSDSFIDNTVIDLETVFSDDDDDDLSPIDDELSDGIDPLTDRPKKRQLHKPLASRASHTEIFIESD